MVKSQIHNAACRGIAKIADKCPVAISDAQVPSVTFFGFFLLSAEMMLYTLYIAELLPASDGNNLAGRQGRDNVAGRQGRKTRLPCRYYFYCLQKRCFTHIKYCRTVASF